MLDIQEIRLEYDQRGNVIEQRVATYSGLDEGTGEVDENTILGCDVIENKDIRPDGNAAVTVTKKYLFAELNDDGTITALDFSDAQVMLNLEYLLL